MDKTQERDGFLKISALIKKYAGVNLPLNEKNLALVANRLAKLMQKYGQKSYHDVVQKAETDADYRSHFINALTTHTTYFFREKPHFDFLAEHLPILVQEAQKHKRELRIWSAAASTGEEIWSIAMVLDQKLGNKTPWKILGTDIDIHALQTAIKATYTLEQIEKIEPYLRQKYFIETKEGWQIIPHLREHAAFGVFNLLTSAYDFRQPFDVIFCRNVLIYFENHDVIKILQQLENCLAPSGFLFVGHSEAIVSFKSVKLKKITAAVYQRIA